MGKILKDALKVGWASKWTRGLTIVAVILIIIGFLCPPLAVIDGSVFIGVGEIFAFAALCNVSYAIERGYDAKIRKGDTEIELTDNDKSKEL